MRHSRFGLIGHPIAHSLSPALFRAGFDGKYPYELIETSDFAAEGSIIGLHIEPDAIHIMKKSEYSGKYGDYSTFSDEMDEQAAPTEVNE